MGPKELLMIGAGVLVLVAVTFAMNWAKNRNSNNPGSGKTQ